MSNEQQSRWHFLAKLSPFRRSPTEPPTRTWRLTWRLSRRRIVFWTCALIMTTGVGVYLRAELDRRVSRFSTFYDATPVHSGGTLLIAGGGQLPNMIHQRFIELAGGHKARIVVIPAAALDEKGLASYRNDWLEYDVQSVDVLSADSRTEADDPQFSKAIDNATGVWLGGGQQTWLAAWYGRTLVESRLKDLLARNGVIGGTSAGAAVMSRIMIAGGREKATTGYGFDLIPGAVIDQHFVKRNRIRRLQGVLTQHTDLVGFGIDEGAALQYGVESGQFRVIGKSCVVACVPVVVPDQTTSFRLEFLNPGDEFDIERLRRGDAVPPNYIDIDSILMGE